jgi:DNA repair protein RecO (recombination protein O)
MSAPREYQTEAVIIRKTRLREADRILTLYTPNLGKLQAVAKAVRKPKSKLSGHLELLAHSQVTLVRGRNLDTVIGSQTINSFLGIRNSLEATSSALYLAEMVNLFTAEADHIDNYKLFNLLISTLEQLNQGAACCNCLRYFEMQLLGYTGYRPELKTCPTCRCQLEPITNVFSPGAGGVLCARCAANQTLPYTISVNSLKVLRLFQDCDIKTALRLKLPAELNFEVEKLLRSYCRYILEREIRSAAWLDSLKMFNTRNNSPA